MWLTNLPPTNNLITKLIIYSILLCVFYVFFNVLKPFFRRFRNLLWKKWKLLCYHFFAILLGLLNCSRYTFYLLWLFFNPKLTCEDIELDFEFFLLNFVNINGSWFCLLFDLPPFIITVESYSVGILLPEMDFAKLE